MALKTKMTTIGHVTIEGDIGLALAFASSKYAVVVFSVENSDP